MPKQWREGLVLIALCALVFLPGLGAVHLWDDDEAYFAETAREMFERDDFLVPWFNAELFAHKPPFMYWMMMGAFKLLGVNEFAARVPSALFGCATVLLIWRLGRLIYSPRVGFWAGVVLATSLNFVIIARAATSDAELTFFCTLPIYLFVRGTSPWRSARNAAKSVQSSDSTQPPCADPTWGRFALIYAVMGVAVLVKGPIGVVLPTAVLGLYLLWRPGVVTPAPPLRRGESSEVGGQRSGVRSQEDLQGAAGPRKARAFAAPSLAGLARAVRILTAALSLIWRTFAPSRVVNTILSLRPLTALALVLLIAGPWYVAVAWQTRGEFLRGFFGVHHFGRFTNPMDNHGGPFVYYFAVVCVGFFPWIIFLSPSIAQWWRRIRGGDGWRQGDVLCAAWLATWFGFFSLASTKFPHYVVPAYPALALVTAAFLDRWAADGSIYRAFHRRLAWITVAMAGLGVIVAVHVVGHIYLPGLKRGWLAGVPLLTSAASAAWLTERGRIAQGIAAMTAGAVAFLLILSCVTAVEINRHQNAYVLGEKIRAHAAGDAPQIAAYGYFRPSLVYYCGRPVADIVQIRPAKDFLHEHPHSGFLLTTESEYEKLKAALPDDVVVLDSQPWFMKPGQTVMLLGRPRATSEQPAPATAAKPQDAAR